MTELKLVTSAINAVESEIQKLDELTANAEVGKATVAKLAAEVADLYGNRAALEPKARVAKLTAGAALLSLEESDLATINREAAAQADWVVEVSRHATAALQEVWHDTLIARKAKVEAALQRDFDLSKAGASIERLVASARCVIEVAELDGILFQYRTHNERDLALHDARLLRDRSASLLEWAATELLDPASEPLELTTLESGN